MRSGIVLTALLVREKRQIPMPAHASKLLGIGENEVSVSLNVPEAAAASSGALESGLADAIPVFTVSRFERSAFATNHRGIRSTPSLKIFLFASNRMER